MRALVMGVLVAVLAAGCAPGGVGGSGGSVATFEDASTYKCLWHTIDASVLASATPVASLTGDAAAMLAGAQSDDGTPLALEDEDAWYFAGLDDDVLLIMRDLTEPLPADVGLPGSDHEIIEISRLDGTNVDPNAWYVTGHSVCPLTIDLGDLAVPTVTLNPAALPDASSTQLELLVTEVDCNSGQPADGRVRLVSLVETAESVTVTIGVEPAGGNQTCPSNPATPFTVKLDAPLGGRTVVDGTRGVELAAP